MYYITKEQWADIPAKCKSEHFEATGGKATFERFLSAENDSANLCFENKDFLILPDWMPKDLSADVIDVTIRVVAAASKLSDENREQWRQDCLKAFDGKPGCQRFIELAADAAAQLKSKAG